MAGLIPSRSISSLEAWPIPIARAKRSSRPASSVRRCGSSIFESRSLYMRLSDGSTTAA